jgi:uncharacterized repeat protein (TIGR02543 family)
MISTAAVLLCTCLFLSGCEDPSRPEDPPVEYTVTFDADGGSPTPEPLTVNKGESAGSNMPDDPAKDGYVFGGWYTGLGGWGPEFTASTVVTRNITVYAEWTLDLSIQYTVTFDADGGSPTPEPLTVSNRESAGSNMPDNPAKDDYVFGGWYTEQNGGGTQFTRSTVVTGDITVYAKWNNIQYTVTFDADGGIPKTTAKMVNDGGSVGSSNMPADPSMPGYVFGGWYTEQNGRGSQFTPDTAVTENMRVYAWWTIPALPFKELLGWLSGNAAEGGVYVITLTDDETIAPVTLSYGNQKVSVTLRSDTEKRTINLNSRGTLFTVAGGVTLTLDNTIVLRGQSNNNASLVKVNRGGTLVMNTGSEISGNTASSSGGGVYVDGTFTMNGGEISGNTASASSGGGVYVSSGTFTMIGGTISGNTASASGSYGGGGVFVSGGTFTMSGGTISGNTAAASGGGVYVSSSGATFTKQSGGIIYGSDAENASLKNTATIGHAVYAGNSQKRNNTAGTNITLDSAKGGPAGGWE